MNRNKFVIPILLCSCILMLVIMILSLAGFHRTSGFIPPPFDDSAIVGVPDVPKELLWSEVFQEGMDYKLFICANVVVVNNQADVYFTNEYTNNVWLKMRIYNQNNDCIAETGLIKPGEYIRAVQFTKPYQNGEQIKMKIMAYEPDTYYSAGSIYLNSVIMIGE